MTLSKLLLTLKGGSGSGHWGHRGRIGSRGGSATGGGLGAIGASPTSSVEERAELKKKVPEMRITGEWNDISPNKSDSESAKIIRKYAKAVEDFEDSSGLKVKVTSISYGKKHSVDADIIDSKTGEIVGKFVRNFDPANKEVHHGYFELNKSHQKKGFGSRFYYASERLYPSMGYDKVKITASLAVGGYAWARMGYDFADDFDRRQMVGKFTALYRVKFNQNPPFVPTHAHEIAAYKGPDGSRLGKKSLLGEAWYAVKKLDSKDEGYQVGLEYYKSKGIL